MASAWDHKTGATGLSPTVTISKAGAAFASPAGAVTEVGSGWYKVAGNATDNNTLGPLVLHATATAADPCDVTFEVVVNDPDGDAYATAANLATVAGYLDTEIADILEDTGTTLPAAIAALPQNKTGYSLAATGLDAVVIETGMNARQAMSVIASAVAGILSGAGTTTVVIKAAQEGTTTRISATCDADGNRSAITLTLPS